MEISDGQRVSFKLQGINWSKQSTLLEHLVQGSSLPYSNDQPIDMSLSSRKRALSEESTTTSLSVPVGPPSKKSRPTTTEARRKKRFPRRNLAAAESTTNVTIIEPKPPKCALIISPEEYSDEGINNHFMRSLNKYLVNSDIGFPEREVDEHFLRSLGWEVWWKLLRQAKPIQKTKNPAQIRPTVLVLDKK